MNVHASCRRAVASIAGLIAAASLIPLAAIAAAPLVDVRMTIDEDPIVIRLAESLGYLRQEGIRLVKVDLEKLMGEDYLMEEPLTKGQIDASYHWFNHTVFGARHGFPIKAVMVFNDAPGMTVMVAKRVQGEIRSAADFKGRNVAEGAGYGTKAVLTGYLAQQAGLPKHAYTPVMTASEGRLQAVVAGLKDGTVDVMNFQEPVTSSLQATNQVVTLYDLNSGVSTAKALGAPFPAQALLMSPGFIDAHPDTVQHLVNALVRSMRWINAHDLEAIVAKLPPEYFKEMGRTKQIAYLKATLPTFAKGDYAVSPAEAKLVVDAMRSSTFDASDEGKWRSGGDDGKLQADTLYDNRFVERAMKEIR